MRHMNFPRDLCQPQGRAPGCTHAEREGHRDETHELSKGFVPASRGSPWLLDSQLTELMLRGADVREADVRMMWWGDTCGLCGDTH